MFIQVMQGKCSRPDELRALADTWRDEGGAGAVGWLGGTYGVTDDDQFIGVIRFASRDEAMANSARPETNAFAEKMAAVMEGPVEFHDCDDVTTWLEGGSDDAGFVQVIRGHTDDPERVKAMLQDTDDLREMRPEIIGGTLAIEADGTFFETIAFTDEESARKGEQLEPPAEVRAELESMMAGATFYDLHRPWFDSP
ncbi:MAG TPA: hypothetical protein VFI40_04200 [Nocardioides sp.]|nr:hypothetical protein [Nocardioides sp.]